MITGHRDDEQCCRQSGSANHDHSKHHLSSIQTILHLYTAVQLITGQYTCMYVWGDNNHLQGTVRNIIIIAISRLYNLYERIALLLAIYNAGCQFQTENLVPWNDIPKRGWNEDWVYDLLYWVGWPGVGFPSDVGLPLYHQINSTFQQTAILILLHIISKIRNKDSLIP